MRSLRPAMLLAAGIGHLLLNRAAGRPCRAATSRFDFTTQRKLQRKLQRRVKRRPATAVAISPADEGKPKYNLTPEKKLFSMTSAVCSESKFLQNCVSFSTVAL